MPTFLHLISFAFLNVNVHVFCRADPRRHFQPGVKSFVIGKDCQRVDTLSSSAPKNFSLCHFTTNLLIRISSFLLLLLLSLLTWKDVSSSFLPFITVRMGMTGAQATIFTWLLFRFFFYLKTWIAVNKFLICKILESQCDTTKSKKKTKISHQPGWCNTRQNWLRTGKMLTS